MTRAMAPVVVAWLGILAGAGSLQAADPPSTKPKVWAIVIGIDRYEDASIPPCIGAKNDARTVAEWFISKAAWGEKNVLRMDDLGAKVHDKAESAKVYYAPTRANLDWAVVEWLEKRVRKDDIVVLYFAGQAGARGPRPGMPAGRVSLLPIDARRADVARTGWSLDDALDRAKFLADRKVRVVLWLDTSSLGRGERGISPEKGAPMGSEWLLALTRWPGVTAWLAADGRPAAEGKDGTTGPFVASLLKAMGTTDQAHNLLGCLTGMRDNPELTSRGFKTRGGIGPGVSLWSGGALVVEDEVPELIVQAGHGDRITQTIVTADNTHLISASQDSTVRVWSLADRSLIRILSDPMVGVEALTLNADNTVLMAGDGVGQLTGWDMTLDIPKPFFGPPEHTKGIVALAFLPGGKTFVAIDRERRSILWDAGGGTLKKVRAFYDGPLRHLSTASRPSPNAPALVASIEPIPGQVGSLVAFDAKGQQVSKFVGPGGRITAIDLASDGQRLAVGDDRGRVVVFSLPDGAKIYEQPFESSIREVRFSKAGLLLIADARTPRLVEPRAGGSSVALTDAKGEAISGAVERSSFSEDGRWLAACSTEGLAFAWSLADPKEPAALALPGSEGSAAISPAFTSDGRSLILGDADGGIRAWTLEAAAPVSKAEPRPKILPSRGKVASLSPSPSGRYLLEITKDDVALVWDLKEGRGCKPLPGSWVSGSFLPDESKLALADSPNGTGNIVVFDRVKAEPFPFVFERPLGSDGKPSKAAFGSLVVSKSGRWIAAASLEAQRPLACVWEASTGKLVHVARDHDGGLTAIDLSGDEAHLLTSSDDGDVKLWPMADRSLELNKPTATFLNPLGESLAITSARFCSGQPGRVMIGSIEGHVFYWQWSKAKPNVVELGQLHGAVNATVFSPDGRWMAASASLDKSIRFWSIPDVGLPRIVPFRPLPHHSEQIGALAAWPDGSMIVSGGDDTAVRFWNLKDRALIGSLVAQARDAFTVDWLAFTPEGLFDGSLPGEAMVKWRVGPKIVTLEQSQDTHHVFQLADAFAKASKPLAPAPKAEGLQLKIDSPSVERTLTDREIELLVWSGDTNPAGLRLYQNGVPVRAEKDFEPGVGPNFVKTRISLKRGVNKFYVMASKEGTFDGRSDEVSLNYDGPEAPGRVHTLAIGISEYKNRRLKYAHSDAQDIAAFLKSQEIQGQPGKQIVLIDDQVTPERIDDAFKTLRDAVKGKPEDTVVLFVAGHTDTDPESDQFCLLLPEFPFQGALPLGPLAARGVVGEVTTRGNSGVGSFQTKVGDKNVLAYVLLYNRLTRLEALQRLIIVDACQAGAILEDPAVRNIQRLVDRGSRKVRNSYLLAARRGEPANEADALQHGLLTYTLLQGLGATGLKPIAKELGGFPGKTSADLNKDGLVTSDELVAYTDDALPKLAQIFPQVVMRAGNAPLVPPPAEAGSPELEKKVKVQSSDVSFPFIAVPKAP